MPTNKTIDCQCGHSITAHLTVCDDCSCYKFESKSKPTPNPQKTVELCPYLEMRGHSLPHDWDSQWCKNCGRFRETLPNTQSPKLAEPHVVQVPQESSPGFEEVLRIFIANLSVTRRPREGDPIFSDVLAAHQKEIQAAKREEREACVKVAKWWAENDGRPKHLIQDLEEPDKSTLEHLEEETTS